MKVLAVDLGGSHAKCALIEDRDCLGSIVIEYRASGGLGPLMPRLVDAFRSLCSRAGVAIGDLQGIAFSFCGLVDSRAGRILSTNGKFPDAADFNLPAWAAAEFGLPLRIENDARMALLGEHYAGAAQGIDDFVMVTLGTGIGASALIGGQLLRGKHFQAGCLGGHFPSSLGGRLCSCGTYGCAESEASGWALPVIAKEWPGYPTSPLSTGEIDFKRLFTLAAAGDQVALAIRQHCLEVWARNAVALIHAYDPQVMIYGGGVMKSAATIVPFLEDHIARHAWTPWGKVRVRSAALGNDAGLFGAVPLFTEAHCGA